jgi:cytoskeletal protein RodZ
LGLSGEEMVQAFDRAMEEDGLHGSGKEGRPGERDRAGTSRQEKPRTWRSVLLILVLLAVLVWLVYFFFLSPADKGSEQKAAPAAAENASQETGARGQAPSPEANASLAGAAPRQPAGGEGNGTEARVSEGDVEQPSPAPEEALEQNRTAGAAQGSGDNRTSRESATAEPQRHQLRIVASEACWISVEVDDGVRDFYLEPGEEQTVTFRGTGTFLLGNAGGVTLYLNGEERPVQAESGEVRELIFP